MFARGALKKLWHPGLTAGQAVGVAIEALFDASDDDSATGGPDLVRRLWPVVYVVTNDGATRVGDDALATVVQNMVTRRSLERRES